MTFADLFATVLYTRCTGCHHLGAGGQSPDVGDRDALVGAESEQVAGALLVVPGDVAGSYLFHKVAGTQADVCAEHGLPAIECGLRMPRGVDARPLPPAELEMVRAFIEGGAVP